MRILETKGAGNAFVAYGRTGKQIIASAGPVYFVWNLPEFEQHARYASTEKGLIVLEFLARTGGAKFLQTMGFWREEDELPALESLRPYDIRELTNTSLLGGILCFGPDGRTVFRESYGLPWQSPQRLALWDVAGQCVRPYPLVGLVRPQSAVFSPDGKTLALVNPSAGVSLLDAQSGEVIHQLEHTDHVAGATFSPDSKSLATSAGRTVRVWSVADGECQHRFRAFRAAAACRAFSPDSTLLLSGSREGRTRIWDVGSGRELADHDWDQGGIASVAFSPDGLTAAAGCQRSSVVVWDVDV